MPLRPRLGALFPLLLVGCAHQASWKDNPVAMRAHREVVAELKAEDRRPAAPPPELRANLADLRRVRPGRFEVYVFPKHNSTTHKEAGPEEQFLGRPQTFEVSPVAVAPCKQFTREGLQRNLRANEAFPAALGEGDRVCAIIEVTSKRLRELDRALLKRDDVLRVRLFLDDAYRVHATDHAIYEPGNRWREVRIVNEEGLPSSAGLGLFPVDLPADNARYSQLDTGRGVPGLDGIGLMQIRKRLNGGFQPQSCRGAQFDYRDGVGSAARVGWCQGSPWPTFTENERFFSVTQPLSVAR